MMQYIIVFLYLFCFYAAARRKWLMLLLTIFLFSLLISGNMFNENILKYKKNLGLFLLPVFLCYTIVIFYTYAFLKNYGFIGVFLYAFLLTLLSFLELFIPLNPLIVLYGDIAKFLPKTDIPILNLLVLNLIPAIAFSLKLSFLYRFLVLVFVFLLTYKSPGNITHNPLNIVVIQVGLYFKKTGFRDNLYYDLNAFIKEKKVDLIIFSENVFFGHKNDYIKEKTNYFLTQMKDDRFNHKYGVLMNFYGYNDINNVVTAFWHQDSFLLHQKSKLIPFFEKKGFFNSHEPLKSPFIFYDKKHSNQNIFNLKNTKISVHICYEGLFPEVLSQNSNISVVQSDYLRLDNGYNYDNVLIKGSILSKFSVAPNTPFINVQNYGGTVLINKNWEVDMDLFYKSKTEPFLFIRM
ncbi:hypothetical protein QMY53_05049 (plasmid) [Escherichia coli TW14425]|nr:hypothetical protein QMY53_05049 [Escherichia coli TW14425]